MVDAKTEIFEMSNEESVSYFKSLENLKKMCIKNPSPTSLSVNNEKFFSSSEGKCSKNPKESNMWLHYCYNNNHDHKTADYKAISKFKQQKKARFNTKSGPGKKSLVFLFEEINTLKRQLNPENTALASNKKRTR
jgi:hypothetical protein